MPKRVDEVLGRLKALPRLALKAPIHLYRWTFKPFFGWHCRHLPTCSDYSLEAIDKNGAWRGGWLMLSRLCRCHPYGTAGYDPVPDTTREAHHFTPWRYGRWTDAHMEKTHIWTERHTQCVREEH